MTCTTCANTQIRDPLDHDRTALLMRMAALGYLNCVLSPYRASFHGMNHRCARWAQADEKTLAARSEWLAKNHKATA